MVTSGPSRTLADVVETTMREHSVPGVGVGLFADGEELALGFGVTSVEHPLAVDGDTLFQIGSITKTFTATAIMRLVERGTLSLDAPVRTYVPELRLADEDVATRVTLRHLLTHHGGWFGDLFLDTGVGDDALARYVARLAECAQLTPLGALWAYSNAGFALAARVLEIAAGVPVESALTELVLKPLGMTRSFFFAGDAITHRVASGHFVYADGPKVARPWYISRNANAIGGVISSARDMLTYIRFHLGDGSAADGTRLLSPELLRLMQTPLERGQLDDRVGLSWRLQEVGGVRFASHTGGTIGQLALLTIAPGRGFGLAVLTNSARGLSIEHAVSRWALRTRLGVETPEPVPEERSPESLAAYAGTYESPGNRYTLRLQKDGLVLQAEPKVALAKEFERKPPPPPPMRIAFFGTDRIVVIDGPAKDLQGEFLRDAAGAIEWLRIGGRIHRRL